VHCLKVTVRLAGSCKRMGGVDGHPPILLHDPASRTVTFKQCTQLATQLHTTTASITRYVLGLLLNHHPLYTNTTSTHPIHHLYTPPWKHLITPTSHTSHQAGATHASQNTHTPNTPDLTDIRIRYQLNTTTYTYTHEIPTMFTTHYSTQRHYGSHISRFFPLLLQCRTPYAVIHGLVLLMMGIMMPETC